jgi:hypothetical protein
MEPMGNTWVSKYRVLINQINKSLQPCGTYPSILVGTPASRRSLSYKNASSLRGSSPAAWIYAGGKSENEVARPGDTPTLAAMARVGA